MLKKLRGALNTSQIIAYSFLVIIIVGTMLLFLPFASRETGSTNLLDCFFTATSATCVTGLVIFDTYTHWTLFGQLVILVLIQIGGLGFMTIMTMLSVFLKKRIGIQERRLIMESAGTMRMSGVVMLIKRIFIGTLFFEGCGAVVLSFRFCPQMGFLRGVYCAVFHSVSAFCNAGFDIMGRIAPFSSFTSYVDDAVVNITLMVLIVVGGLGFFVWSDIIRKKFKFNKFELHSKIVIIATAALILIGAALFFFLEKEHTMAGMDLPQRILTSLFASVTPRTAGFNTIDCAALSDSGRLLTIILMFIGGSPCSTAGGIKTTTFVVVLFAAVASARRSNDVTLLKHRINEDAKQQASSIMTIYLCGVLLATILICAIEPFGLSAVLFETVSAAGTVGLTTGITSSLSALSKIIIMILMYAGRIGGLTLALILRANKKIAPVRRPEEKILVG